MFKISELPQCTIHDATSHDDVILSECGEQIQWLTDLILQAFPKEKRIGIIFPTGRWLILTWLAALKAGKEPCLLHSPTEKISKDYWRQSIRHTMESCALQGLIHGASLLPYKPDQLAKTLLLDGPIGASPLVNDTIGDSAVIQLSSGTTGHKKGVRLTGQQLHQHVANYNQVMKLGTNDVIVSWLPLYHDMGFIACFVMPLMLKVPIVMIDPMAWVKRPEMLLTAIEQYRGTVCYMPNFGFEVMARQGAPASLATMRHWISCSEPTYFATLDQFCRKLGVAPASVSTCYAMAENVFAVAQSAGIRSIEVAGERLISCGPVIPGTHVKVVGDEIHVKSDTSLVAYVGQEDLRDATGFYATGDLGRVIDGEIYISGRKRDIMNSGGKKYFLNDFDFAAGKIIPSSAGRIAALAQRHPQLGTETVIILVERQNFWDTAEARGFVEALRAATDLEALELHFVPPAFITKTSSGKINRKKTLEDWCVYQGAKAGKSVAAPNMADHSSLLSEQIRQSFPTLPPDRPLRTELDSLGSVLMRLICESHGIAFDPEASLYDLLQKQSEPAPVAPKERVFSIVALVDGIKLGFGSSGGFITDEFITAVAQAVGAPVRVEHLTVPPIAVLFSDLVFHDYFMARDAGEKYGPFSAIIRKIKDASLILIDDEDAFRLRHYCAYPRLSHRFNPDAQADLLGHRLQSYTLNHHLLAREVATGRELDPLKITESIVQMSAYLDVPIMKLAFHREFAALTEGWDYTQYRQYVSDVDYQKNPVDPVPIQGAITRFIAARAETLRYSAGVGHRQLLLKDLPHFCSFLFSAKAIEYVLGHFRSFCIAGLPSSIPYIEQQLKKSGKPYFYATTLNPERTDYECMLCTGFHGKGPVDKPYFDFVHIGDEGGGPHNVSPAIVQACPSLAAGDDALVRAYRNSTGNVVPIGNYVLNQEENIRRHLRAPRSPVKTGKPTTVVPPAVAHLGSLTTALDQLRKKSPRLAWNSACDAVRTRPHHPEAFLVLAEIARMVGDSVNARHCGQHAQRLAPAFKPARKFLQGSFNGNAHPDWLILPQTVNHSNQSAVPRLSVCLIVKNEERFIGQCLESIKGVADQIVVVDTGSTDRTVEIAQGYGAEIHSFTWCDDFSAARNAALQYATGDWVLSLDADEELPVESHAPLRQMLANESVMAWRLPLFDVGNEENGHSYVPRLFRNAPGLFFIGRVHEQVFYSVDARRKEWGLDNRVGDAALRHHGYTKEIVRERGKVQRNLLLLERAIEEIPDDPSLFLNYGLELIRSGRMDDGLRQYRVAFEMMTGIPASAVVPETREVLLTQYCTHLLAAKRPADVLAVCSSPLAENGGLTASLHFMRGLAHMELQDFPAAAQQMRFCLDKRALPTLAPINPEIRKITPRHCLAICLWQTRDLDGANQEFQIASAEAPAAAKVQIDYARFLHENERTVDALQLLNQFCSAHPGTAETWAAGGRIALSQPALLEVAIDWTAVALNHHPDNPTLLTQRAEVLTLAGQLAAALPLWLKLNDDSNPQVLAARILCEAALQIELDVLPLSRPEAINQEFTRWYWRLVEFGAEPTILQLHSAVGVLEAVLPAAAELLHSVMAKLATADAV
jgi:acyl-CoA synthetase (AMP-forming)/AMP-acid ligase II/Tfp pilus assembly protein PilF